MPEPGKENGRETAGRDKRGRFVAGTKPGPGRKSLRAGGTPNWTAHFRALVEQHGEPVLRQVIDQAMGRQPVLDDNGRPVLNEDGTPAYKPCSDQIMFASQKMIVERLVAPKRELKVTLEKDIEELSDRDLGELAGRLFARGYSEGGGSGTGSPH